MDFAQTGIMLRFSRNVLKQSYQTIQKNAGAYTRYRFFSEQPSKGGNSGVGEGDGVLRKAWNKYCQLLEERPVLTKSVTSGAIGFVSDLSGQYIEHTLRKDEKKSFKFDAFRCFRFTLLGTILVGPVLHYWYGFIVRKIPGTDMIHTLQRVFFDQLVFAPSFVPLFFAMNLILEGKPELVPAKLNQMWWPSVKANWSLWVPAMLFNFKFVPPHLQVLFANVVAYFWNVYLSIASNSEIEVS